MLLHSENIVLGQTPQRIRGGKKEWSVMVPEVLANYLGGGFE